MSCGLAIFVKTPALSPVKTRMWPGLGRGRAEALHRISAEAVASVAAHEALLSTTCYWAVAETEALHTDAWQDLPHLPQGGGGLGERMAHVYARLRRQHHAAILVGADAPQLTAVMLQRAAAWLGGSEPRLVLGPAEDGGFWLFGGNCPLPDPAWTGVRYSAADTASQFVRAMNGTGRWLRLESLRDLDTTADLAPVQATLARLETPTPAQARLRDWLAALPEACT